MTIRALPMDSKQQNNRNFSHLRSGISVACADSAVWIRLPTNQGLKLSPIRCARNWWRVWIRLPTNQGLKPESFFEKYCQWNRSESDFQQIKDWNNGTSQTLCPSNTRLNPTSNKSRIETKYRDVWRRSSNVKSESDFQQIKDWNIPYRFTKLSPPTSLNPTSNKSRIETTKTGLTAPEPEDVWIRLPTNQGLKLDENGIIVKSDRVWIRLPTNQGLKLNSNGHLPSSNEMVWIRLPTNQGLKHIINQCWVTRITRSESDFQQIKDWNPLLD